MLTYELTASEKTHIRLQRLWEKYYYEDDKRAFSELCNRCTAYVKVTMGRYMQYITEYRKEECYSHCVRAMVIAIQTWDETQSALHSWIITKSTHACREFIRANSIQVLPMPRTLYEFGARRASIIETVYRDWETDRKSTRLNSSHSAKSRMPSSA